LDNIQTHMKKEEFIPLPSPTRVRTIIKEVIKEVMVPTEVIKEVMVPVEVIKEVMVPTVDERQLQLFELERKNYQENVHKYMEEISSLKRVITGMVNENMYREGREKDYEDCEREIAYWKQRCEEAERESEKVSMNVEPEEECIREREQIAYLNDTLEDYRRAMMSYAEASEREILKLKDQIRDLIMGIKKCESELKGNMGEKEAMREFINTMETKLRESEENLEKHQTTFAYVSLVGEQLYEKTQELRRRIKVKSEKVREAKDQLKRNVTQQGQIIDMLSRDKIALQDSFVTFAGEAISSVNDPNRIRDLGEMFVKIVDKGEGINDNDDDDGIDNLDPLFKPSGKRKERNEKQSGPDTKRARGR